MKNGIEKHYKVLLLYVEDLLLKVKKFQNVGIPIVRISNIGFDGTVGGEFEYYSKLSPDEKFVLKGRSLLLAMSGATTGKIAMLDSEEEYYQNQRVGYFQNNGAVDYDFISSVLQTKAFTNQLNAVLVAGAQPNISSKEIDSFFFVFQNHWMNNPPSAPLSALSTTFWLATKG